MRLTLAWASCKEQGQQGSAGWAGVGGDKTLTGCVGPLCSQCILHLGSCPFITLLLPGALVFIRASMDLET